MVYNRFRIQVVMRAILLAVTISCFYFLVSHEYQVTSVFALILFFIQIYQLINYVEKTNRELARFINSIKFSDFSQSFTGKNYGTSFQELNRAFNNIIEQFQKTRSETEEHFQYLQTVVSHIKIGLISYNSKGEIELINDAAKDLLKVPDLINIHQLAPISDELVKVLSTIETGKKSLLKLNINGMFHQLSIAAAEFKMKGRNYTLISLQDISSELENERLSNELEIARDVQLRLLPKENPVIPGYSVCARCIPAFEVGGDYYDFIQLGDNKIGIVIADVSGKGLASAFYMTLTKGAFQSYAASSNSPKEVLRQLNSLLYRTIDKKSFITMFYAILDYNTDKIIYARAGHEPAIYLNKNGKGPLLLKPEGIGLGLEKGDLFSKTISENEITLSAGDLLFFYTDGITDSKNESNADFGINNLITSITGSDTITPSDTNTPGNVIDQIFGRINSFKNKAPQYDDMTLIALSKNKKV